MHVLFVSPVPSHPQDQGNASRVYQLGRALQLLGATLHFVYVQIGGLTGAMREGMEGCWDRFDTVPVTKSLKPSVAGHYLLDDWYEPELDALLRRLFAIYDFDVVVSVYVWYSRAFAVAPASCFRVLDAQDLFGERHQQLMAHGVAPAWFYTSQKEEARGLARADCILAIQDEEAQSFRSLTDAPVHVLGHLLPAHFLPPRRSKRIRIGYVGSSNPTNLDSMRKLCAELIERPKLSSRFGLTIAGSICDGEIGDGGQLEIERLGALDDLMKLYGEVDLLINPNVGGSGLKIKSVEAFAYGLPFVATVDAMVGLGSDQPEHRCVSAGDLCDVLEGILSGDHLARMAENSRQIFLRYQANQLARLEEIFDQDSWRLGPQRAVSAGA